MHYALALDTGGFRLKDLLEMPEIEVYAMAKLRARFYKELYDD